MKIKILGMLLILLTMIVLPKQVEADGRLEVEQEEIYVAEVFSLYFYGFEADPSSIRIINAGSQPAEAKFSIIGEGYNRIFLRISEVISYLDKNQFVIEIKDKQGNSYRSQKITLIGKKELPLTVIKFNVLTTCNMAGKNSRIPIQSNGYLYKESDKSTILAGYNTSKENGHANVTYTSSNIGPRDTFVIQQEPIGGMVPEPFNFIMQGQGGVLNLGRIEFEYPTCPVVLPTPVPTPSPTPASTLLPTPSPTPPPTTNIKVNATVLCGVNEKLTRSVVYMKREDGGAVVTSAEINGKGTFEYSGPSAVPGQGFILQAAEFPDEPPIIQSGLYPIVVPDPAPPEITVSALFSSPYCPGMFPLPFSSPEPNITGDTAFYYASPIPSPTPEPQSIGTTEPQGGLPQPTESPASQQTELTQVMISNYADFRFYNDPDDQGNSTISISNPNDPQNLEWTAKTMGSEKRMYTKEIYSDGTYRDFEYIITHNDQRSSVSNIQILIKIVKKVARITIGNLDLEIDVKNPQVPLDFHLPGTEGQSQQFKIPVVITYSDGSTLHTALTFNYNPPNLPNPVPSPVSQTCTYSENFECTGKNAGCGGGSGEMKKTIINSDCSEKFETYCDSACASSGGGGSAGTCNLAREYNECGNDGGCFGVEQAGRVYRVQQFQGEGCSQEYACEEVDNCSAQGLQCEGDRCVSGGSGDNQTSECEDVYYCDNGTTIHKHGYHDGNKCQYTWDDLEEPC